MMWRPHSNVGESEAFITGCSAAAEAGTRLPYVLSERETGEIVGMLEARPAGHRVDLGYALAQRFWGLGYMPEAVAALASAALREAEVFRVQALCDVENVPSQRTLEKAGFTCEGRHERFVVHPNVSLEPRTCYMYAKCR